MRHDDPTLHMSTQDGHFLLFKSEELPPAQTLADAGLRAQSMLLLKKADINKHLRGGLADWAHNIRPPDSSSDTEEDSDSDW